MMMATTMVMWKWSISLERRVFTLVRDANA